MLFLQIALLEGQLPIRLCPSKGVHTLQTLSVDLMCNYRLTWQVD